MKTALPISILLALLVAACSSTPTQSPAPVTQPVATASSSSSAASTAAAVKPVTPPKVNPYDWSQLKNPASLLSKREVFFDYDSFEVKLDYFPILEQHSKFLKANPTAKVLIQGNADERGSSEYNLALGQKRADAIKKSLSLLGVKDAQIESVSLGKEKPKATGHDEAAWSQNRRGDLLYKGEY